MRGKVKRGDGGPRGIHSGGGEPGGIQFGRGWLRRFSNLAEGSAPEGYQTSICGLGLRGGKPSPKIEFGLVLPASKQPVDASGDRSPSRSPLGETRQEAADGSRRVARGMLGAFPPEPSVAGVVLPVSRGGCA